MRWWNLALYDTCSLITLDKILIDHETFEKRLGAKIVALEESFTADQMRADTAKRIRKSVKFCPLPPTPKVASILGSVQLSKALSDIDSLIYATAIHNNYSVVTADRQLAKAIAAKGLKVGNMALILRELVQSEELTETQCEKMLQRLAARKDFILGTPDPHWSDLHDYSFPD